MKGLINIFVRRNVTVIMILSAVIIAAIFSAFHLPVNQLPDFIVPRVTVETLYPGMASNEIRSMVTIPLEDSFSSIKGLERIRSISRDNRSFISLDFRWGIDPMAASVLVREAVDTVYPSLPEGVRKPAVTSGASENEAHIVVAVSSLNGNAEFARKLAEYEIQSRLRRIDGVGSVVIVGGEIPEERIILDVERLTALGFTPSEFAGLLAQETVDIPAGNAREGNMELVIVSSGRPESISSLSQIILPVGSGAFRVEDAGEIISSIAKRESVFVYNGNVATALEIYRRPGSDPVRLSREIKKTLDEAASLFSRDVQIELIADFTPTLIRSITGLVISATLGAIAVVIVLFLFLRSLKYSFLVSFSIPFSIAAGICMLSITGKSLNSMSLGGLAMGISLVSDISIIVLELLHRSFGKREKVPDPKEIGNKVFSIAGSSITSTLTTTIVFIPIIMLPGALGTLFGDIAISLVTVVITGWFYAQFCLPSLYRMFFYSSKLPGKNLNQKINLVFLNYNIEKKYLYYLSMLIRRPKKIFAVAVLLSFIGLVSLIMRPVVFINPDDAKEVWVSVVFPPGTLLEVIEEYSIESSRKISGLPYVNTVYGRAGSEEGDVNRRADIDYRREELILRCVLNRRVNPQKALSGIKLLLEQNDELPFLELPFLVYFPKDRSEVLLGLSSSNTYVIKGRDREELLKRLGIAENEFNEKSIHANFFPRGLRPELRYLPNRETSAFLSVPAAQIAETLFILNEGIIATRLEIEGRPLDVRVTGQNPGFDVIATGLSGNNLEQIPIITPLGRTVFLGSLGNIVYKEAEASLARLDRQDIMYVEVSAARNNSKTINRFVTQNSWFSGVDDSVFSRYKNSLIVYVFLVLILLYMTMGALFESFLLPIILMISIPFSLAGAGPALLLAGSQIDSGAVLGLIVLFGLVVNNSLILFEISDQKIKKGFTPAVAVFNGARERYRAILITMLTTIFALLPLIISPMGNSQKSMAAAMLGGLTVSTLLSLFVIPAVLIRYFKWKKLKVVNDGGIE